MKYRKILVFSIIILFIFSIYYFCNDKRINYVVLGDSIARGQTPYKEIGYGYTDYIRDYLNKNKRLGTYDNYSVSGYKINDIINDIELNKKINDTTNIRKSLRESNLVTISIGANDFISDLTINDINFKDIDVYFKKIDSIFNKMDDLMKLIRSYAKDDIIIVGYYNPLPFLYNKHSEEIDLMFKKIDNMYRELSDKYNIKYVSIYELFRSENYLPNPSDIHPNLEGYKAIGKLVIDRYNSK